MELKVGDKVYSVIHGKVQSVYEIERVTSTQAITKNGERFKRLVLSSEFVLPVKKQDKWSSVYYCIENDKLKEQLKRQTFIKKLSQVVFTKLSTRELERLCEIITEQEEK